MVQGDVQMSTLIGNSEDLVWVFVPLRSDNRCLYYLPADNDPRLRIEVDGLDDRPPTRNVPASFRSTILQLS